MNSQTKRPFKHDLEPTGPASFLKRLLAMFYDGLLLTGIWMTVGLIAVIINNGEAVEGPFFKTLLFSITFLFYGFFWTRLGQTLGMQAWRLRVQTLDGYAISWKQAILRFCLSILSWMPLGLGYLSILTNKEKLAWHDKLSDTCVVQLPMQKK